MSDHEEPDIDALHRAVLRERAEPVEGREPIPWWIGAGALLLVAWGGWYLGRYDANFDPDRADMHPLPAARGVAVVGGDGDGEAVEADLMESGAALFTGRCAACHQANGQGLAGVAPPLDGSEWVTGDATRTTRVVLHGLTGPIEVAGEPWNGAMPAWGSSMNDEEIAAVLTYIRGSWSNSASPVSPGQVEEIRSTDGREKPWTAEEL